jgi:hypothetical protein
MIPFEQSPFSSLILYTLKLRFGTFYLCRNVIVAEVFEGVVFTKDHAEEFRLNAYPFYENLGNFNKLVYISNRINKYSVKAIGWLNYKYTDHDLVGYCVVDSTPNGIINALLESKFVPITFKSVKSLQEAIEWAATIRGSQISKFA